ncbi:hypothetical protein Hamer_G025662 [Homarus americanus]|uniref:Uncharacterized protein n=1 Tax=Homarus americanus TaxID=6706 RepID=A0A8J5TK18_HOMAM|nr:hypothetical protein Hamer_G025662 [Homarus americanus]
MKVPVRHKIYKKVIAKQPLHLTHVERVVQDVLSTNYYPEIVTTTVVIPQVRVVTDYEVERVTLYRPVVVKAKKVIPKPVIRHEIEEVVENVVIYDTVTSAVVLPSYETAIQVVYSTVVVPNLIPHIEHVVEYTTIVSTICPGYGH